jgi:hypothetical protein
MDAIDSIFQESQTYTGGCMNSALNIPFKGERNLSTFAHTLDPNLNKIMHMDF